ncbi:MAG TPA: hypothetical protein VMT61_18100 [Candidatus Binataceae bacterium]|nr:hypothetical protein [Candidatus Binataceae bacterium]
MLHFLCCQVRSGKHPSVTIDGDDLTRTESMVKHLERKPESATEV